MSFNNRLYEYPYTNPTQPNLDWLLNITQSNTEQLEALAKMINDTNKALSTLSDTVNTLSNNIAGLTTTVSNLDNRVSVLESSGGGGSVSGDYVTTATFDEHATSNHNDFFNMNIYVNEAYDLIDDLNTRVTALEGGSSGGTTPIVPPKN